MRLCHIRSGVYRAAALLLAAGLLSSCGSKEPEPDLVNLTLQLTPGMERTLVNSTQAVLSMSVRGLVIEVDTTINATYDFTVKSVDGAGASQVEVKFVNAKMTQTTTFGDYVFSTVAMMGGRDPFQRMAGIVRGKTFTMSVDPLGMVGNIEGLDAIRKKVEDELDLTNSLSSLNEGTALQTSLREAVLETLEDENMRLTFTDVFETHTNEPIQIGDSWPGRVQDYPELDMTLKPTFTLTAWDGVNATVERRSDVEMTQNGGYLRGTETSTFTVDGQTGLVKRIEAKMILNGTTQAAVDPSANRMEIVDAQMKSTQTIEVLGS